MIINDKSVTHNFREPVLLFRSLLSRKMVNVITNPRAKGAERRSERTPGARVLIPPGYLHPGKRKH
jgi:hypothetical protein